MSEAPRIVALSRRAQARGEQLCLATVVHVEGSSYRKPGARMLITSGGERAGTISGGCLESEVSRKAWWLTAHGPRLERYASFAEEDGSAPYGLGCGGTVSLLLEQAEPAGAVLAALEQVLSTRQPAAVIMALGSGRRQEPVGTLAIVRLRADDATDVFPELEAELCEPVYCRPDVPAILGPGGLTRVALLAFRHRQSLYLDSDLLPCIGARLDDDQDPGQAPAYFVEYLAPPAAVTIFGAGDDAQPLAELARALGWRVRIADGRSHLARRERFPQADEVQVLHYADAGLRTACGMAPALTPAGLESGDPYQQGATLLAGCEDLALASDEIAVILTHSYEQDRALLAALLPQPLVYLGVLGPRHRTERLLGEIAPGLGLSVEAAFARLHSPIGLDLGTSDPASVALSIISEIQAVLHGRRVAITRTAPAADSESPAGSSALLHFALPPVPV